MKKLSRLFVNSLKDRHGEFNFAVIYLMISIFISLIILVGLFYQIQEKSFLQQEHNSLKQQYQILQDDSKESITEYEKIILEKESLNSQIKLLESKYAELEKNYNILAKDFETLNENTIFYKDNAQSWEHKFNTLYSIISFKYDIVEKYNNKINGLSIKIDEPGNEIIAEEIIEENINNEDIKLEVQEESQVESKELEESKGEEVTENEIS